MIHALLLLSSVASAAAPSLPVTVLGQQVEIRGMLGAKISTGTGVSNAGTQRVTLASDQSVVAVKSTPSTPVYVASTETIKVNINSGQSDAFGRVRTSDPVQLFESQLQYDDSPLIWDSSTSVTGASAVHLSTMAGVQLSVGTSSGAFSIRQTKEYFRYQPSKSQSVYLTAVVGPAVANVTKEWGYGDRYNGIFFRQTGAGFFVLIRSTAGGTFQENIVAQSDFNIDKVDGTGASKFNIDLSSGNIFEIDLEWLGVGEVRLGVVHNHEHIIVHRFTNSNRLNKVYMATANLPINYKVVNTSASVGGSMLQICAAVQMEGGTEPVPLRFSTSTNISTVSVTTRRPILTIRNKTRFNGQENRARTILVHFSVASENSKSAYCELIHEGTLGGASFQSAGSNSQVEVDLAATTIAGGHAIDASYVPSSGGGIAESIVSFKEPMAIGYNADDPGGVSIVCTSFSTAANLFAHLEWEEFR